MISFLISRSAKGGKEGKDPPSLAIDFTVTLRVFIKSIILNQNVKKKKHFSIGYEITAISPSFPLLAPSQSCWVC